MSPLHCLALQTGPSRSWTLAVAPSLPERPCCPLSALLSAPPCGSSWPPLWSPGVLRVSLSCTWWAVLSRLFLSLSLFRLWSWGPCLNHFCILRPGAQTLWELKKYLFTGLHQYNSPSVDFLLLYYVFPWVIETRTGSSTTISLVFLFSLKWSNTLLALGDITTHRVGLNDSWTLFCLITENSKLIF